jgi:hypothetical protein
MKTIKSEVSYQQYMSLASVYDRLLKKSVRLQDENIELYNKLEALRVKYLTLKESVDKRTKVLVREV